MLVDFTIENYRSIKEPVTLSTIYFNSIRNELRSPTLNIIVLPHQNKTDPRSIIERLIEERQQRKDNQQ
ncbi:MAG: hypothetical protein V7K21_29555 [Nostoc sp.]|uniref:hypothetical protein n=1 Tax=Nostoc sp. TaxID=1180 RepID=UPI002FF55828